MAVVGGAKFFLAFGASSRCILRPSVKRMEGVVKGWIYISIPLLKCGLHTSRGYPSMRKPLETSALAIIASFNNVKTVSMGTNFPACNGKCHSRLIFLWLCQRLSSVNRSHIADLLILPKRIVEPSCNESIIIMFMIIMRYNISFTSNIVNLSVLLAFKPLTCIKLLSSFPLGDLEATSSRSKSPDDKWVKPYLSTIRSHWVPFPLPGPPTQNNAFIQNW